MFPNELSDSSVIIAKLADKGAQLPCPRCGKSQFHIIGETVISVSTKKSTSVLGGALGGSIADILYPNIESSSIPTIIVGCDNCGYLIQHAKGPLGLSS